ncbi:MULTISPECIES: LLM class flavin-dependent oxidoreductase [unclassified Leifsonia]|uniref:LLM class flavin-dependent oxidoreductase n=1 Tax=unclassified Leifsonia TaxID=2663824 RepID=UPI0009258C21|nr:LLM class flavin-dependent oxidoreductase [Leifsonia sp. 71-9]OJX75339.1 MAG: 5,10-methylene tetrahydromethanopterin reductase [Leifsonia sp. 71-9]
MAQQIRLNAFTMNSVGHLSPGLWRHPRDESRRYLDLDYWTGLAQTLERGLIDAVFLADVLGVYDVYGGSRDAALRGGVQVPVNDPLQVIPAMAAATEHLGFGVTASVSFEHPYPFARRMSTLDHLTRGRIGWNVVTSYLNSGALNLGVSGQEAHDRRYEIAEEYLEVAYKLWERSWDDDAVVADAETGVYAHPDRVHPIEHEGEFFRVPGIHLSEPSPQRTPFLFQAGASPRGVAFAARHAENVFVAAPSKKVLAAQVAALREAVGEAGRDPDAVAVINQQTVIVAETDAEAQRRLDEYLAVASTEGALTLMSGWTGIDFSRLDPDAVLRDQESNAIQSVVRAFSAADPDRAWTVREIAEYARIGGDGPVIAGSAETVADALEEWVDQTGVGGFNLAAAAVPETFEGVVDLLVPELQRRGRYQTAYRPGTLREKLGATGPRIAATHPAAAVTLGEPVAGNIR